MFLQDQCLSPTPRSSSLLRYLNYLVSLHLPVAGKEALGIPVHCSVIDHTVSVTLGKNRGVLYQVPPSSLSRASKLASFQKCLSRVKLRDWHSLTALVIRDQHPRRLQLLPCLYWCQTAQPLPWVLLGKRMPNHPASSYSIKNVYNPVNSNISAACYRGTRSLGEKGKGKKECPSIRISGWVYMKEAEPGKHLLIW